MSKLIRAIECWAAGLIVWLPGLIVHLADGCQNRLGPGFFIGMTVLPVIACLFTLKGLLGKFTGFLSRRAISLWLLLGAWMLAPAVMAISGTLCKGGFFQPGTLKLLLHSLYAFPAVTWMLSAYDGSMLGLVVTTVILMLSAFLSDHSLRKLTQ